MIKPFRQKQSSPDSTCTQRRGLTGLYVPPCASLDEKAFPKCGFTCRIVAHKKKKKKLTKHESQLQTAHWPAYLVSVCRVCYIANSLLFRLMKGDKAKIWNSQLRTSRKAVTDIITGRYRIWSKRPNNKVTSFPRNNRNLPSSSHHCIPVFMYLSLKELY